MTDTTAPIDNPYRDYVRPTPTCRHLVQRIINERYICAYCKRDVTDMPGFLRYPYGSIPSTPPRPGPLHGPWLPPSADPPRIHSPRPPRPAYVPPVYVPPPPPPRPWWPALLGELAKLTGSRLAAARWREHQHRRKADGLHPHPAEIRYLDTRPLALEVERARCSLRPPSFRSPSPSY